jgi:hypothetical protein
MSTSKEMRKRRWRRRRGKRGHVCHNPKVMCVCVFGKIDDMSHTASIVPRSSPVYRFLVGSGKPRV